MACAQVEPVFEVAGEGILPFAPQGANYATCTPRICAYTVGCAAIVQGRCGGRGVLYPDRDEAVEVEPGV